MRKNERSKLTNREYPKKAEIIEKWRKGQHERRQ